jgi:putative GTP pyrophosphokinase
MKLILKHVGSKKEIKKALEEINNDFNESAKLILKAKGKLDKTKLTKKKVQTKSGMAFRYVKTQEDPKKDKTAKLELKGGKKSAREVAMQLEKLAEVAKEAKEKGENAPNFNLCEISIPNTNLFCENNKGVERKDMPQLKGKPVKGSRAEEVAKEQDSDSADGEELFKEHLKSQGNKMTTKTVPAEELKATQNELVGAKVAGMTEALKNDPNHEGITAPIFVSKDGYVLDGHHRWAAHVGLKANTGKEVTMDVIEVDMDIEQLLDESNKFADDFGIAQKAGKVEEEVKEEPLEDKQKKENRGTQEWGEIQKEVAPMIDKHEADFEVTHNQLKKKFPRAHVTGRIKEVESATDKVFIRRQSKPEYSPNDMMDLTGLRVDTKISGVGKDAINRVMENVEVMRKSEEYDILEEKNYIEHPKGTGYRRYHLICQDKESGKVFEVQLGTVNETKWADWCHDVYKPQNRNQRALLSRSMEKIEDYAKKWSEVYNEIDLGKKQILTQPPCDHEIKVTFGCLS